MERADEGAAGCTTGGRCEKCVRLGVRFVATASRAHNSGVGADMASCSSTTRGERSEGRSRCRCRCRTDTCDLINCLASCYHSFSDEPLTTTHPQVKLNLNAAGQQHKQHRASGAPAAHNEPPLTLPHLQIRSRCGPSGCVGCTSHVAPWPAVCINKGSRNEIVMSETRCTCRCETVNVQSTTACLVWIVGIVLPQAEAADAA